MKYPSGPPPRLVALSPADDPMAAAERLMAAAETPFEISATARRRIRARLRQAMTARSRPSLWRARHALVVAILLLFCGGVVGAAVQPIVASWIFHRRPVSPAATIESTPGPGRRSGGDRRPEPSAASAPAPTALPTSAPPAPAPASRAPAADSAGVRRVMASRGPVLRSTSRTSPPGGGEAPAAETESTLLANAIRELRARGDALAALTLLERRAVRYPQGAFAAEGAALRIEALLKLGRRDEALRDLEQLPVDSLPRGDEWRTVRGELRAESARWREAEVDFDAVLREPSLQASAKLTERALWGRAVSRARMGNAPGARSDYIEYLRRFPNGRFAREAARAAAE